MTCSFLRCLVALVALVFLRTTFAQEPSEGHFFFQWPQTTSQCEVVTLMWNNAMPPFAAWILPMGSQPFLYDIPDSAYTNGSGSYDIQLQLDSGTDYIVIMSDSYGIGSGGASVIQQVAGSQSTECLNTASQNQTASDFSWSVSGQASQCQTDFDVIWSATTTDEPYNYTVLPLDQGFYPFDVALPTDRDYESNWQLNLTAGTRFTIVMNDKNGRGTGGVGGIYQVANSSSASCVTASMILTGSWPVGIATNTLRAATIPTASSTATPDKLLSGGTIGGIVVGAVVVVIIIALLLLFLLSRRRRRRRHVGSTERKGSGKLDLADVEDENSEPTPIIEPYRGSETIRLPGEHGRESDRSPTSTRATGHEEQSWTSPEVATLGAGRGRASWAIHNYTPEDDTALAGEGPNRDWSGVACPGRAKSPTGHKHARQSILLQHQRSSMRCLSPGAARDPADPGWAMAEDPRGMSRGVHWVLGDSDLNELPALPPVAVAGRRRSDDVSVGYLPLWTTFRRHEDAGTVDFVDLPPLYSDIQRGQVMRYGGAPAEAAGMSAPDLVPVIGGSSSVQG